MGGGKRRDDVLFLVIIIIGAAIYLMRDSLTGAFQLEKAETKDVVVEAKFPDRGSYLKGFYCARAEDESKEFFFFVQGRLTGYFSNNGKRYEASYIISGDQISIKIPKMDVVETLSIIKQKHSHVLEFGDSESTNDAYVKDCKQSFWDYAKTVDQNAGFYEKLLAREKKELGFGEQLLSENGQSDDEIRRESLRQREMAERDAQIDQGDLDTNDLTSDEIAQQEREDFVRANTMPEVIDSPGDVFVEMDESYESKKLPVEEDSKKE